MPAAPQVASVSQRQGRRHTHTPSMQRTCALPVQKICHPFRPIHAVVRLGESPWQARGPGIPGKAMIAGGAYVAE
jgi:hypothetical protein